MKPIETRYKGYRFRSRLEARWAVFFDTLGTEWRFEPEGFVLEDGTHYLPDFWLPDLDVWVEIKPFEAKPGKGSEEVKRCLLLAKATGKAVIMLFQPENLHIRNDVVAGSGLYFTPDGEWEGCATFGFDATNEQWQLGPFGHRIVVGRYENGSSWAPDDNSSPPDTDHPQLLRAFERARSARFEHGEAP